LLCISNVVSDLVDGSSRRRGKIACVRHFILHREGVHEGIEKRSCDDDGHQQGYKHLGKG